MKRFTLCLILLILFDVSNFDVIAYDNFNNIPTIQSPSAILMDATTGRILYEKNAHSKMYPASITKLMTSLLAIENLKPNDIITFSKDAIYSIPRGSSHIGIRENEKLTVDQALHGLLLESANEVANGISEHISKSNTLFANKMNARAKELGALNTHFVNPHGLHDENHYTTAYDMARITLPLSKNKYYLDIMKDSTYEIPPTNQCEEKRILNQRHRIINKYKDKKIFRQDAIGGKNGYTKIASYTLVTISKRGNQTLIAVVLKSTSENVYSDTNILLDYGFNNHKIEIIDKSYYDQNIPITDGTTSLGNVNIGMKDSLSISLNKNNDISSVKSSITMNKKITSSVKKQNVVGFISFYYQQNYLGKSDLIVKNVNITHSNNTKDHKFRLIKYLNLKLIIIISSLIILLSFILIFIFKSRTPRSRSHYRKRRRNTFNYYR